MSPVYACGSSLDFVLFSDVGFLLEGDSGVSALPPVKELVLDWEGRPSDDMEEFRVKRLLCSDCLLKASKSGFDSTATWRDIGIVLCDKEDVLGKFQFCRAWLPAFDPAGIESSEPTTKPK